MFQLYFPKRRSVRLETVASHTVRRLESVPSSHHHHHHDYTTTAATAADGSSSSGSSSNDDVRLFVTTMNCGGMKDVEDLGGNIQEWIPQGYDLYW